MAQTNTGTNRSKPHASVIDVPTFVFWPAVDTTPFFAVISVWHVIGLSNGAYKLTDKLSSVYKHFMFNLKYRTKAKLRWAMESYMCDLILAFF